MCSTCSEKNMWLNSLWCAKYWQQSSLCKSSDTICILMQSARRAVASKVGELGWSALSASSYWCYADSSTCCAYYALHNKHALHVDQLNLFSHVQMHPHKCLWRILCIHAATVLVNDALVWMLNADFPVQWIIWILSICAFLCEAHVYECVSYIHVQCAMCIFACECGPEAKMVIIPLSLPTPFYVIPSSPSSSNCNTE